MNDDIPAYQTPSRAMCGKSNFAMHWLTASIAAERNLPIAYPNQWADNAAPFRQPAAISETGGLRGSKATERRRSR